MGDRAEEAKFAREVGDMIRASGIPIDVHTIGKDALMAFVREHKIPRRCQRCRKGEPECVCAEGFLPHPDTV